MSIIFYGLGCDLAPSPADESNGSKAIPLPTYDQSEKYEKDGVLEYTRDEVVVIGSSADEVPSHQEGETDEEFSRYSRGTLCEFVVFFIGNKGSVHTLCFYGYARASQFVLCSVSLGSYSPFVWRGPLLPRQGHWRDLG